MDDANWYMRYISIKAKLAGENIAYDSVLSDLEKLKEASEGLGKKLTGIGMIEDGLYLQLEAIHVLIISKFEYLLRAIGRLKNQWDIVEIINSSKHLTRLEKDHLIYLFLIRHTIVHKGGYFDEQFFKDAEKHLKQFKLEIPKDNNSLSPVNPKSLTIYIDLIKKVILLDIARDKLSAEERKLLRRV